MRFEARAGDWSAVIELLPDEVAAGDAARLAQDMADVRRQDIEYVVTDGAFDRDAGRRRPGERAPERLR